MRKAGKQDDQDSFLTKYMPHTIQHQVTSKLKPIISAVKNSVLQANSNISRQQGVSISGDIKQDDEYATKVLYNRFFDKRKYPSTVDSEVCYPHNEYSIYTPVSSEIDLDDEFVRTFPILKKHKDEFNAEAKSEFYAMLSREISTADPSAAWKRIVKKWIWEADMTETLFYYHMLMRQGYSILPKISQKYPEVEVSAIQQQLQRFAKMFHKTSTIRSNTQFSIDINEEINEISIVKSAKQLFCPICFIYDCPKHKLQDSIIEDHNQFVHVKNKPILSKKLESAAELLKVYQSILSRQPCDQIKLQDNPQMCSIACYLNLNSQSFKDLKYQISLILSPVVKAIINLGVQMFYYSPCFIALLSKTKMSCSMVFWYFLKVLDIEEMIPTNFKPPSQYYSEIGTIGPESSINPIDTKKKPKRKSLAKRKTAQNQEGKSAAENEKSLKPISYTTPICYHYFLNKETGQETQEAESCENCACKLRGFCLPSCMCPPKCQIRMKGCTCCQVKKQGKNKQDSTKPLKCSDKQCPCREAERECHPEVCHGCFPIDKNNINQYNKIVTCNNNQYQLKIFPKLKIGVSSVAGGGIGLFANEFIPKRSIIIPYCGEAIENFLEQTREKVANDMFFYNFAFNDGCIDAKFFGNKARFINHDNDEHQNCYSSIRFARSDYFLAVYAYKDINKDQELFFDYDGVGTLFKNFRDKYSFIKQRRRPFPKP